MTSLIRWLARRLILNGLSKGQTCDITTGQSLTAGLIFVEFKDPFGIRYEWTMTPDKAREWAWTLITAADQLDNGND